MWGGVLYSVVLIAFQAFQVAGYTTNTWRTQRLFLESSVAILLWCGFTLVYLITTLEVSSHKGVYEPIDIENSVAVNKRDSGVNPTRIRTITSRAPWANPQHVEYTYTYHQWQSLLAYTPLLLLGVRTGTRYRKAAFYSNLHCNTALTVADLACFACDRLLNGDKQNLKRMPGVADLGRKVYKHLQLFGHQPNNKQDSLEEEAWGQQLHHLLFTSYEIDCKCFIQQASVYTQQRLQSLHRNSAIQTRIGMDIGLVYSTLVSLTEETYKSSESIDSEAFASYMSIISKWSRASTRKEVSTWQQLTKRERVTIQQIVTNRPAFSPSTLVHTTEQVDSLIQELQHLPAFFRLVVASQSQSVIPLSWLCCRYLQSSTSSAKRITPPWPSQCCLSNTECGCWVPKAWHSLDTKYIHITPDPDNSLQSDFDSLQHNSNYIYWFSDTEEHEHEESEDTDTISRSRRRQNSETAFQTTCSTLNRMYDSVQNLLIRFPCLEHSSMPPCQTHKAVGLLDVDDSSETTHLPSLYALLRTAHFCIEQADSLGSAVINSNVAMEILLRQHQSVRMTLFPHLDNSSTLHKDGLNHPELLRLVCSGLLRCCICSWSAQALNSSPDLCRTTLELGGCSSIAICMGTLIGNALSHQNSRSQTCYNVVLSGLSTITQRFQLEIWFRCTIPVKFVLGEFQLGLLHPAFKTLTVAQWLDHEWQKQTQRKTPKTQISANIAMTISLLVAFITGSNSSVSTTAFLCYHIPYKQIVEHAHASQS
jgi:hypothetical protein